MLVNIGIPEKEISAPVLNAGLEAVTRLNVQLIKSGKAPDFSALIRSGARWAPEPPGQESFDHAGIIARRGWGDCDDWAPTHAASLRASGVDPKARAVVYKSGPNLWHAITQRGDGSLQDPSQTAGMRVRPGSPTQGIPPAVAGSITVVGGDGATPTVALRQAPAGYWVARTDLPMTSGPLAQQGGTLAVRKSAVTPAKALGGCCLGAAVLGGASRYTEREPLDKLYALAGLLRGDGARSVANVVGREAVREAIQTIAEICPQVFEERS